jgi:alpha-glucosidase
MFFEVSEPILAFSRGSEVVCVFNLSPEPQKVRVTGVGQVLKSQGAELQGEYLALAGNGFALFQDQGAVIRDHA